MKRMLNTHSPTTENNNLTASNKRIRTPSVRIKTTSSHDINNDIKIFQKRNKKNHIPSVSCDDDSLETASSYLRV